MKKILDINENPMLTSFSYYAFPIAILSTEEKIGNKVAGFRIDQLQNDKFFTKGNIYQDGMNWEVLADNDYLEGCNACIYRELNDEDYIELETLYQQYANAWSAVNIFISDDVRDLPERDEKFIYRFGSFFYNGINLYKQGKAMIDPISNDDGRIKLLFSHRNGICEFYRKNDKSELIARDVLKRNKGRPLYIGVQVKNGDNMFYRWLHQNFLQLSCDLADPDRRLEFHYGIKKDWDQNSFHYFLNMDKICYEDVKGLGGIRYIRKCIDRNTYAELEINQKFIKGRDEYGAINHYHQNLIYGYSDKLKIFYILGYSNKGKVRKQEITFSDLKKSMWERQSDLKIVTYHQDAYFYEFDRLYVMNTLQEYLAGTNSKIHTQYLFPKDDRVYGIQIYDELKKDAGIDLMISDRRMAHVLWEHKKLMIQKIEYLVYLKELTTEQGAELVNAYTDIEKLVYNMKNLLLKYQMCPQRTNYNDIRTIIDQVCCLEKDCLVKWLNYWKG